MTRVKRFLKSIPFVENLYRKCTRRIAHGNSFQGSSAYWEDRYRTGGNSGAGSYNSLALFKAEILNAFVRANGVQKVIEFGCGDGNQLSLFEYPCYIGL